MSISISKLARRTAPFAALIALVVAMDGTWATAQPAPNSPPARSAAARNAATTSPSSSATASSSADAPPARSTDASEQTGKRRPPRGAQKELTGKLNLNTATEEQLMLLPTVGASKAERIITWRKKNGGFKRVADLRRVKGFGYKTLKRLEPYLDIQGETTLAVKQ